MGEPANFVPESDDDTGLHLIVHYFKAGAERQREYDETLFSNLQHEFVSKVHIMLEDNDDKDQLGRFLLRLDKYLAKAEKEKIVTTLLGWQMKYSDAFQYSNQHLAGKVCVILNGDIAIGEGVDLLMAQKQKVFGSSRTVVLSLTRHEKDICRHRNMEIPGDTDSARHFLLNDYCGCPFMKRGYAGSHDSFWFIPPIKDTAVSGVEHVQNRWGAEHKVINVLTDCNYILQNPSRSIRTYHIHRTGLRPWSHQPEGREILADPRHHDPLPPTIL